MLTLPSAFTAAAAAQSCAGLNLEWQRGRVFDQDVGALYANVVKSAGSLRIASVSSKDEVRSRPSGLNTVELLKVASSNLNIGPAQAMQVGATMQGR